MRISLGAVIGALVAAILNIGIAAMADAINGTRPLVQSGPDGGLETVSNTALANASFVPALIALALFLLLRSNVRRYRLWFLVIADAVLVLSLVPPLVLEGSSTSNSMWLIAMHVVTALSIITALLLADRSATRPIDAEA